MPKPAHKKGRFHKREPKEYEEEVIQIDRVTRVVKGGRKLRFRATVVIGNRKGKVGIGIGKSHEVTGAIQKGIAKAKRNLITVPIDGTTVPHDLKIKFKASKILFIPAGPGTGIIAGGAIRKILELTGIKDTLSKSYGTTNKVNNTKATFKALGMFRVTPGMAKRKKASAAKRIEKTAAKPTEKTEANSPAAPAKGPSKKDENPTKKVEDKKEEIKK